MDNNNWNGMPGDLPPEEENQNIAEPVNAEEVTAGTEPDTQPAEPAMEEIPAEEVPETPGAANGSSWQGGYSYQNPNPYQNFNYYYQQPPKKKNTAKPWIIAAATAGAIMLICCVIISAAIVRDFFKGTQIPVLGDSDTSESGSGNDDQTQEEQETTNESQRDESVVYNAPEIVTGKKEGEELSLSEIYKKVKNSVVGILISDQSGVEPEFSGSGFIISKDGYIITNEHVVTSAVQVKVVLCDGITEYSAKIVGSDSQTDLAVLKVEATGLSPVELGDSDDLEVGETVAAIGNPYGMELMSTMHNGIVSALNRKLEIGGAYMTLIQTNALINPGNSGGPLVNAYGQVVGITSSKLVADGYEGIGFAIPINDVTGLVEELINYGYVKTRGYIGIQGSDLSAAYAEAKNLPQGVYVVSVDSESDAAKKGLQKGDVIIAFGGETVESMAELTSIKDSYHPGDQVTIKVWRDGNEFELTITLTEANS